MDRVRKAEIDILRYLSVHQDARDTIEGIQQWWLPQTGEYGVADIAGALRRLQRRDLIRVWKSASTKPVYGLWAGSAAAEEYLRGIE